jgi:exodeoxyribonuclease VII small subunit
VRARLTAPATLCNLAPGSRIGKTMAKKQDASVGGLEQSLKELEALVERLEAGDLPLEEALKQFEHGVKLTRSCETVLKEAEQKVEILLKKTGQGEPAPFEPAGED